MQADAGDLFVVPDDFVALDGGFGCDAIPNMIVML